jgi:hypothetical protein
MTLCTGTTRQGVPCRNQALSGTRPPRCRHHRPLQGDLVPLRRRADALQSMPATEQDLTAELRLVREVLSQLAERLDDPDYALLPSDLRTLATLIYSGVRTVAYLMARQPGGTTDLQTWVNSALDVLGDDWAADL